MTGESMQYCIDWMALTDELKARRDTQDAGTKDLLIYQHSFASQNGSCHDYDKQYLTFPYRRRQPRFQSLSSKPRCVVSFRQHQRS